MSQAGAGVAVNRLNNKLDLKLEALAAVYEGLIEKRSEEILILNGNLKNADMLIERYVELLMRYEAVIDMLGGVVKK